jgi:crossover junction endodeoxyribonuclease RusA
VNQSIHLRVNGIPVPQGSKQAFIVGKGAEARAVVAPAGSKDAKEAHKAWRQSVTDEAAKAAQGEPWDGPVAIKIEFVFPRPKAAKHRTRHTVKPDLDKLIRSVLDSLVAGGLLVDDARICEISASKFYVSPALTPGAFISLRDLSDVEAADRELLKNPRSA